MIGRKRTSISLDGPISPSDSRRAVAYPLAAGLVIAIAAAANFAVYFAGLAHFVQIPSIVVPVRNVLLVAAAVIFGRLLMRGRSRSAEQILLTAAVLFGIGLAMQFRLGHEAPPQLAPRHVEMLADSVAVTMPGASSDSIEQAVSRAVARRNAVLRAQFRQSRVDVRLARKLESSYGPSDTTRPFLEGRPTSPMDPLPMRILPVLALLLGVWLFSRTGALGLFTSQWRAVGLWGSIGLCVLTWFYLSQVGGIRGAALAPQELLKITVPIAWAGILVHYRKALLREGPRIATSPLAMWLYVLVLLALPLIVFVAVRDFGQFLTIGLAQVLLLAWFSRSALYVLLFGGALTVGTVALLGVDSLGAPPIFWIAVTVVIAGVLMAATEKFRTKEAIWPQAVGLLAGIGVIAWMTQGIGAVRSALATPRARFALWSDLYERAGDGSWWDRSRQIVESLFAVDAGGMLGEGLGEGSPFLIPKASSDFIYAAIVEETGVVGGVLILLLITALIIIGMRVAINRGRGSFIGLLLGGYVLLFGSQAFIHVAGTLNLMPMTGITLPLVSIGTSSLTVTWFILGAVVGTAGLKRRERVDDFVVVREGEDRISGSAG